MDAMSVSRRGFIAATGAAAAAGALAAASAPASADESAQAAASRTYEGEGYGNLGPVRACITLSEDGSTIEHVGVTECNDTPGISTKAVELLPGRIVAANSIGVDAVSGATVTSMGIVEALRNALEGAGVDPSPFEEAPEAEYSQGEDVECDVLVIGGGASGLTASISARTDDNLGIADSGLSVVLVEQLAYTGGCFRVSDTVMWSPNGSRFNDAAGESCTDDELVQYTIDNPLFDGYLNEELWRKVLSNVPSMYDNLLDRGMYMPVTDALPGLICPTLRGAYWSMRDPLTGYSPEQGDKDGYLYAMYTGGPYVTQSLEWQARVAGVDIRTETRVDELVLDGKTVTAVNVTDKANHMTYAIHPKQVVLATGCLGANTSMVYENEPSSTGALHFGCAGTTGDGINWVVADGGVMLKGRMHYVTGPDSRLGHYGPCAKINDYAPRITVNKLGERFYNEGATSAAALADPDLRSAIVQESEATATYIEQPDNVGYLILSGDAVEQFASELDYAVAHRVAWKADSLEELAELAGIDPDGLLATVEKYNADYAAGNGSDFGIEHDLMTPVAEQGPYYALMERSLYNLLDYGVKVSANCVPVGEDGEELYDNLHTAGSIQVSNYSFMWGGISHATALTTGIMSGGAARHALIG